MKKTKRLFAILLATLLAFSMIPMTAFAETATETTETTKDPQAIYTADDFVNMSATGNYYLANDIDFSELTVERASPYYYVASFMGVLDGRGHTLKNLDFGTTSEPITLTSEETAQVEMGIFQKLGSSSDNTRITTVITNLNIGAAGANEKIIVRGDGTFAQRLGVGVLCGNTNDNYCVTVTNVNVYADIDVQLTKTADTWVSGLVALARILDVSDCSFNGAINLDRDNSSKYVGAFCGQLREVPGTTDNTTTSETYGKKAVHANYNSTFSNCVNNADITVPVTTKSIFSCIGGIVGVARHSVYLVDCVNNGNIDSDEYNVAGIVGHTWTNLNDSFVVIADCTNNGEAIYDIFSTYENAKYITNSYNSFKLRRFVYGCKVGNTLSEQNLPVYDPETMTDATEWAYKCVIPLRSAADFQEIIGNTDTATGGNAMYAADAFYVVEGEIDAEKGVGVIDFSGKTYGNYVVENFSGVLYGNNNVFENLKFEANAYAGFFRNLSNANSSAILKLDFGSDSVPVSMTQGTNNVETGILAGKIGGAVDTAVTLYVGGAQKSVTTNVNYDTFVSDVDFYMDMKFNGRAKSGAIAGAANKSRFGVYDCNVYGEITATGTQSGDSNVGTIVGVVSANNTYRQYYRTTIIGCNVVCDIDINSSYSSGITRTGYSCWNQSPVVVIANCNNLGNVTFGEAFNGQASAAIHTYKHGSGTVAIVDCANYAKFNNADMSTGAVSMIAENASFMVNSLIDYADNGLTMVGGTDTTNYTGTPSIVNCVEASVLTMEKGASVRIDPDPEDAGLRFTSVVDKDVYKILVDAYGADAISYGTIITPTEFVTRAGGDFDLDALRTWATGNGLTADTAYIEVTTDQWFSEEDYKFAGSVNGLKLDDPDTEADEDMFDTNFSAISYVKVTSGDKVNYFYSTYNATDNSRNIVDVTKNAIDDVLYKKANEDDWYSDAECATVSDKADKETYVTAIGDADANGVTKYSCYTAQQYADLLTLYSAITTTVE